MKNLTNKIKSSNWSGVLSLSLGTILSQGINVLIQPLLTRLLTPAELGQYSYILSMANLFLPIASLNLNLLIVTTKDESEVSIITKLSMHSVLIMTIIYYLLIILSQFFIKYDTTELFFLLTINPLIIFTTGLHEIFMSHHNRNQEYSNIAKAEIMKVGSMSMVQVISGILNFGVTGQLLGKLISPVFYLKGKFFQVLNIFKEISIKEYISNIRKYLHHISYSVPSQFISNFSYTLIMLSIVSLYSTEEVGYYSLSVRVLVLPIILISYNLSKVYLQKISTDKNNNRPLFDTFLSNVKVLSIISILVFSTIAFIAPKVTEIIFGDGYKEAGYYIGILCIMFAVRLVSSSMSGTFIVIEKQHIQMLLESLFIVAGAAAYIISRILILEIYSYLILISVLYGVVYAIVLFYIGLQCKIWDNKIHFI